MNCIAITRVRTRPLRERVDPWLLAVAIVLAAIVTWLMVPLATGAIPDVTNDTRIQVTVPIATAVTPGWTTGDPNVRLPNLSFPGEPRDVTSAGWKMSTNWSNGYEVRIRSTTDPALRGSNSVDGDGARSSFMDFTTGDCPCPWTGKGFQRGVFGYSVSVSATNGATVLDTGKWGTDTNRRWRGFSRESFRAYSTEGGTAEYTMSIHLRSMIPDGTTQLEGSYRAGIVVSAHPIF
ncbi:MAG: hypothetical protein KDC46_05190 [Thermoleophilia bacterium]|nr:hypothetical protein [Thermoleophilia bacterium]